MVDTICFITDAHLFNHAVGTRTYNIAKGIKSGSLKEKEILLIGMNNNFSFSSHTKNGIQIFNLPSINFQYFSKILFLMSTFFLLIRLSFSKKINKIFAVGPYSIIVSLVLKYFRYNFTLIYDVPGISRIERKIRYNKVLNIHTFLVSSFHLLGLKHSNKISTINKTHKYIISKSTRKEVIIVRDGADRDKYFLNNSVNKLRADKNISEEEIVLIFVGSISLNKLKYLISVAKDLVSFSKKLRFIIVGSGNQVLYFKTLIKENNLESRFTFTGFVSEKELIEYMNLADMSYSDYWSIIGFPRKIFEYMAAGLPIVVKDSNPIREVLKDGRESFLYKTKSDLKEKLKLLISDKSLREKLGINSRALSKNYTWHKSSQILLNSIEESNIET